MPPTGASFDDEDSVVGKALDHAAAVGVAVVVERVDDDAEMRNTTRPQKEPKMVTRSTGSGLSPMDTMEKTMRTEKEERGMRVAGERDNADTSDGSSGDERADVAVVLRAVSPERTAMPAATTLRWLTAATRTANPVPVPDVKSGATAAAVLEKAVRRMGEIGAHPGAGVLLVDGGVAGDRAKSRRTERLDEPMERANR